jgi:hypothetical protein
MLPTKFGLIWPRSFRGEHLGSIYVRYSIKILHMVPFGQQTWPPRAILFSDWLMLKKSSPIKLLGQMEPNLAGSIYVRSSIKFLNLYRVSYIDASCQVWFHLAKEFQGRRFV